MKHIRNENTAVPEQDVSTLARAMSGWYVRRDSKFYDIDRPTVKLSKDDVVRACLDRFATDFPDMELSNRNLLKAVYYRAIDQKHAIPGESIPVWDGSIVCDPGNTTRLVRHRGVVSLNDWRVPEYRQLHDVAADMGVAEDFFRAVIPRDRERTKFLDWLAWSLQYEADKPAWAPFLYSETKGSGKSTLCQLVARLFGDDNTAVQNNTDKLTSRFNSSDPKALIKAFRVGSIIRNTVEKVSCDGIACLSFRKSLKKLSFARPNVAIPAQPVAPHSTATKAITRSSPSSWRALSARGSGMSAKAVRKMSMAAAGSRG